MTEPDEKLPELEFTDLQEWAERLGYTAIPDASGGVYIADRRGPIEVARGISEDAAWAFLRKIPDETKGLIFLEILARRSGYHVQLGSDRRFGFTDLRSGVEAVSGLTFEEASRFLGNRGDTDGPLDSEDGPVSE